MQRRKFIAGLGSLAAAGAAGIGTGAFNFANVERDANISVVDDSNSFLALNDESQYADGSNDALVLDFESGNGGTGMNTDSDYSFTGVFSIENQGSQSVGVWIEDNDSNDVAKWYATTTDDTSDFSTSIEGSGNAYALDTGEKIYVNCSFLLRGQSDTDLPDTINVKADASGGN